MQFDRGYLSPYMATDMDKMEAVIDDALILITDKKITNIQEILPLLEQIVEAARKLLIIAEDVEGEALATIILNKLRGTFTCVCVKAPGFGDRRKEMLRISLSSPAVRSSPASSAWSSRMRQLNMLGQAHQVKVTKENTIIVDGAGDASLSRPAPLRSSTRSAYHFRVRQGEAAGASGKAVRRRSSHQGRCRNRDRDERKEASHRGRSQRYPRSSRRRHCPGGGTAYVIAAKAADKLVSTLEGDEKTGAALIAKALKAPIMQIAANAGLEERRYPEQHLQQHRYQLRLRRRKRQVRRHDRARHRRSDQGLPQRSRERRFRRLHGSDH